MKEGTEEYCDICIEDGDIRLLTCCKGKYICENCRKLCTKCPFCRRNLPTHRSAVKIVTDGSPYDGKLLLSVLNYKIIEPHK